MLEELQRYHATILDHLREMDELTAQGEPPMSRLTATRLALTRASRARTLLIERAQRELAGTIRPEEKRALDALVAEGKNNLVVSAQHIGSWTLREIEKRWADYCRASNEMRAAMRRRVAQEAELVYPLLARQVGAAQAA